MITFSEHSFNTNLNIFSIFNVNLSVLYTTAINKIDFNHLSCPHCHCTTLTRPAYYHRCVRCKSKKYKLPILRVYCLNCHHTHAILPDWITPYSQFLTSDLYAIITSTTKEDISLIIDNFIDIQLSHIHYIKTQYSKYWKSRLSLLDEHDHFLPIESIIDLSFSNYHLQFMQIRQTINQLHLTT
ncbi:MAG: DUF6431 domain-containing protein [Erysipelotrichaceae bacterium]